MKLNTVLCGIFAVLIVFLAVMVATDNGATAPAGGHTSHLNTVWPMLLMLGGVVLGVCYLVFPFVVMSRLKALEKQLEEQTGWLKHSAKLQKRQAEAAEELVEIQRTQGTLPPPLTE